MVDRVACIGCGGAILVSTALETDGYCRRCRPSEERRKHIESQIKSAWLGSIVTGLVAIFLGIGAWVIFLQWRWPMLIWLLIFPIVWGLLAVGQGVVNGLTLLFEGVFSNDASGTKPSRHWPRLLSNKRDGQDGT